MAVIRIANSNDLDQLVGLVEQYRAFYKQDSTVKTKEFLTDRFTNNEAVIFVAELNNQLVGFTL